MRKLVVVGIVGLLAQLVDGALGMGYGVTSTSLLVGLAALSPAAASASVHLSEMATNIASGVAHWRLKNVDWKVVARIALPGAIGAFLGATVLSRLSTQGAAPLMSGILLALGIYLFIRFLIGIKPRLAGRPTLRLLAPLGLFAGFIDATGGGGWGPVATPALLTDGRMPPRKVIGSIDTAEFCVSAAASIGFVVALGSQGIHWGLALALLVGGVIAAPIAAYLVRIAPAHLLGIAVAGLILLTNTRTILKTADSPADLSWTLYAVIFAATVLGLVFVALRHRNRRTAEVTATAGTASAHSR
ncbi:sulfite exporter TauE/SafE family protein [Microlunatus sp. Gsoil 973]|uniref:sulfite exporter TauE/SafE family protein n=1 Tax=Microlunatus sp. Gsoil 973 TaxID=2672569 RepID=UPI0012B489B6|nr:sulfite exporter TauE/SafE family protein [Microlunatus sp. Gsoil 973]QGN35151.1 TSUP family transporter [Microlunatus sp. Gsoil 973]